MKSIYTIVIASLIALAVTAQEGAKGPTDPTDASFAEFDKKVHNFGILEWEGDGKCTFTFTNTGNEPLILKNVKTSCGCTTPGYSKEPIQPGEEGFITAKYDTKREGPFTKSLTVIFMDNSQTNLTIKGTVKPRPSNVKVEE